jgi:hypothetical protein
MYKIIRFCCCLMFIVLTTSPPSEHSGVRSLARSEATLGHEHAIDATQLVLWSLVPALPKK